ncbi:enhancer of mRNA decapping [Dimargaris verticillata]|uniref:Enhancer of mRNA-decapping protein 3 n=1 Tax=Dimargaris verticillata TaxID=2761393 RepID=A0A9W8EBK3_9FUNG|nr:enhancer of mRNA decapping [Dimargaris verticillata]
MSESFVGVNVCAVLKNGLAVTGVVESVDPDTQVLTLVNAASEFRGRTRRYPTYQIAGSKVVDIQILSDDASSDDAASTQGAEYAPSYPSEPVEEGNVGHSVTHLGLASYVDPAIISVGATGTRPSQATSDDRAGMVEDHAAHEEPPTVDFSFIAAGNTLPPTTSAHHLSHKAKGKQPMAAACPGQSGMAAPRHRFMGQALASDSEGPMDDSDAPADSFYGDGPSTHERAGHHHQSPRSRPGRDHGSPRHRTPRRTPRQLRPNAWASGDVDQFKDEEFDFQSNLSMFDKKKVFDEIRSNDATDPDTLLVNLNIKPQFAKPAPRNLAPTENVLDPMPASHRGSAYAALDESSADESETEAAELPTSPSPGVPDDAVLSAIVAEPTEPTALANLPPLSGCRSLKSSNCSSGTTAPSQRGRHVSDWPGSRPPVGHLTRNPVSATDLLATMKGANVLELSSRATAMSQSMPPTPANPGAMPGISAVKPRFKAVNGTMVPGVARTQFVELERILATEVVGPSKEQLIENAGRSSAMLCLQILGGSRRIQPGNHNAPPVVLIMAGNNRLGAIGVCGARHLVNHGCEVVFVVASKDRDLDPSVFYQQRLARLAGARLIGRVTALPDQSNSPVDLIVDGLLGATHAFNDIAMATEQQTITQLIQWANENKAPVLALEVPSGHTKTSQATNPDVPNPYEMIVPRWTLCFGAPSAELTSRAMSGELTLADMGVPHALWKRVGVRQWRMPWGADYLVGLEYC